MEPGGIIRAEPFELMQCFCRKSHDPLIRCRMDFGGRINVPTLMHAVDASAAAAPLIMCSFDRERHAWTAPGCCAEDVVDDRRPGGDGDADAALLEPLGQDSGPRMAIRVVPGEEGDALCVVVDHMACDGVGFKEYLYLLAALYTSFASGPRGAEALEGYPLRRDFAQVTEGIGAGAKLRMLATREKTSVPDPAMVLPMRGGGGRPRLCRAVVAAAELSSVRASAKALGATVNDALLAAYARALRDATGCPRIVLPCPVDLRRYGPAGRRYGICNLTGNYFCDVRVADGDDFDKTLRSVAGQMAVQKEGDGCLKGPLLFHMLARVLPYGGLEKAFDRLGGVPTVSYTNLGIIDEARLRFGDLETRSAWIATAAKRPPSFQASASTFRGECTLTSCLEADGEDANYAKGFLGKVTGELRSIEG